MGMAISFGFWLKVVLEIIGNRENIDSLCSVLQEKGRNTDKKWVLGKG